MEDKNRLLSLTAVQEQLSLSAAQVAELIRTGDLQVLQILGELRIESSAVDGLIGKARERAGSGAPPALLLPDAADPASGRGVPSGVPTVEELLDRSGLPPGGRDRRLTPQQRRVLILVGEGLPNDQIAQRLSLEVSTVKSHVARLLRRLDLPDRGRLIAYAWREGLLRSAFGPALPPEGGSQRDAGAAAGAQGEMPPTGGRRAARN